MCCLWSPGCDVQEGLFYSSAWEVEEAWRWCPDSDYKSGEGREIALPTRHCRPLCLLEMMGDQGSCAFSCVLCMGQKPVPLAGSCTVPGEPESPCRH